MLTVNIICANMLIYNECCCICYSYALCCILIQIICIFTVLPHNTHRRKHTCAHAHIHLCSCFLIATDHLRSTTCYQ
ncbi:hypothetical protein XENTR_v10008868 [Xenopus tropicalis]|nr:hypothetical protein XENTR_v10008868 [Xenopus tropicalis]